MFHEITTEQIGFTLSVHMEKLDSRVLHLVMYLSTESGVSFQTAQTFAVILAASFLAASLQAIKNRIKTVRLSFVWSLLKPHSSKPAEKTSKNMKVKNRTRWQPFCLFRCPMCAVSPSSTPQCMSRVSVCLVTSSHANDLMRSPLLRSMWFEKNLHI